MRIGFQIHVSPTEVFPWEHSAPRMTIGRLSECDLSFRGAMGQIVSGRHAQVDLSATGAILMDLGSSNGTFLNGVRVTGPTQLKVGDQIVLGHAGPRLEVVVMEASPSAAATPDEPPPLPMAGQAVGQVPWPGAASGKPAWTGALTRGRLSGHLPLVGALAGIAVLLVIGGIWFAMHFRTEMAKQTAPPPPAPPVTPPSAPTPSPAPVPPPTPAPPPAPRPSSIDKKLWTSANLVLINPIHYAVAIRAPSEAAGPNGKRTTYQVLAKAAEEAAVEAVQFAWETGVPIIADEPALVRKIYVSEGDVLDPEAAQVMDRRWRERHFLPTEAELVSFVDVRNTRARRFGYLMPRQAGETAPPGVQERFRDLTGKSAEPFRNEFVQPGSLRRALTDEEMQRGAGYDYAVYHVAKALSTPPGKRSYLNLLVACENRNYENRVDSQNPPPPPENSRETEDVESVENDIRKALMNLDIPVVERRDALRNLRQSGFRKPSFDQAREDGLEGVTHALLFRIIRGADPSKDELAVRLVSLAEDRDLWIGRGARSPGEEILPGTDAYLLAMGRQVLLDFPADRIEPPLASARLLFGGLPLRLPNIVVRAAAAHSQSDEPLSYTLDKEYGTADDGNGHVYPVPPGFLTRLGFVESNEGEPIAFRELFGLQSQLLDAKLPVRVKNIRMLTDVPEAHQLRYVAWRLAKTFMPPAARVLTVASTEVVVGLGRDHGVLPGERLEVIRLSPSASGEPEETTLPVQLILRQVSQSQSSAMREGDERDSGVVVGDIVFRKLDRPCTTVFADLDVDTNNLYPLVQAVYKAEWDKFKKSKNLQYKKRMLWEEQLRHMSDWALFLNGLRRNWTPNRALKKVEDMSIDEIKEEVRTVTSFAGEHLIDKLQGSMVSLHVPIVERKKLESILQEQAMVNSSEARQLREENIDRPIRSRRCVVDPQQAVQVGRLLGATYMVFGTIAPGLNSAKVNLRIVNIETGRIVDDFQFDFNQAQMDHWKPD